MWHELTEDSLANAADRAYEEGARVRQFRPGTVAVPCSSGMHKEGHRVEFERRADGTLWARCSVGEAQGCPAELSRRPCWHIAAAAVLFLAVESMRVAADPDGATEHAVQFDGPMPKTPARRAKRRYDGGDDFYFDPPPVSAERRARTEAILRACEGGAYCPRPSIP